MAIKAIELDYMVDGRSRRTFWNTVRGEVMALFEEFFVGSIELNHLNYGIITLITKSFLRKVLLQKGLDDRWVTSVMHLVSSERITVNINGEIGPYFPTVCGVRQGDPFSPFVFNMVVDALASILDKAKAAGHIHGVAAHLVKGNGVSLLQYANDTIIMVEGSAADISNLKFLLLCFQQMSSLKIKFDKSKVMVM
ncbi:ABC transporter G family member 37 [Hordeum vulgare]|nr:ABC transporter G family member 37 [Hordeum vulgare]